MKSSMMLSHTKGQTEFQWWSDKFSLPLYSHDYLERETLRNAVLRLCFRCKIQTREATVEGLEKIILDLFVRYETSEGFSPIGLFTSNGSRTDADSSQYAVLRFTGKALRGYLSKIEDSGFIEVHQGTFNPTKNQGYSTKVRATESLIEFLKEAGVTLTDVQYKRINPIVFTNDEGETLSVDNECAESRGKSVLEKYNDLLQFTDIRVGGLLLYPWEKQIRRIFKNSEATKDGRHYGGIWQVLPSKARSRITINGMEVSECDIRSTHPLIAYALAEKDLTELRDHGFDPYKLNQLEQSEVVRELVKTSMLMMINCKLRGSVKTAIQGKINKSSELYELWTNLTDRGISIDNIVQWIIDNNKEITKFFFTGSWDVFNHHESNIAQAVIEHFIEKGIIVLTVYDSFIIQKEHRKELESALTGAIAVELMTIFMSPSELVSWSDSQYTDTQASNDLIQSRIYRDKFTA